MSAESPLKLPPLQQAELDAATLEQLFSDLATCTRVLAVQPRRAVRSLVPEAGVNLAEARAGLADGTLRGVQVRYVYEGREWHDTLLPLGPGRTRLVRICTADIAASVTASA
jgi:hypothetical protein